MPWPTFLAIFLAALVVLLALRVPVGFAMLGVGTVASLFAFGSFSAGINQVSLSVLASVDSFTLTAIPLFVLMGEILFRSGIAQGALAEISIAMRRFPGRLAMVSIGGGALFGLLSGSTLANTALFGKTLLPEMRAKGYSPSLGMGSILASGGLAMILPPSALAILWGAIADVPIGPLLIAGIVPGFLMAIGYGIIVLVWSRIPGATPPAELHEKRKVGDAAVALLRNAVVPGLIIVAVLGMIFFGIATPTESAAIGAVASVIFALFLRTWDRKAWMEVAVGTAKTSGIIFFILLGSNLYAQLMSFSGTTRGLVTSITDNITSPALMLLVIMAILLVLGAFIDQASIMLVTAPLFMPIVAAFGWDPVWFSILLLINLQIANTTPPFGMSLFVMRGVVPDVPMTMIYKAALPWILSDVVVIILLAIFPILVTFLPATM
ncbi:TRAP transporter large permease subunit [Cryobacterium sp. PH29-G1]|uniref:TRAP transporter large permease n=1 Tax=Cryobacterium sp. PH29-G1 TaxID=3046211 RepID=UPI0024B8B3C4|nr:TRAP transporter large permease subunit [Cryobacterium sp. PH29-G1]MDJ0347938.1 TRAP transporter large permease subunit [Cryobacterium sp. PH29-G1]